MDKGTSTNPIYVVSRNVFEPQSTKTLLISAFFTVLPVAIVVLMQKPALRQSLRMRSAHYGKEICQPIADFFQKAATGFAQEYNKARM
jgi:hypothetical protein